MNDILTRVRGTVGNAVVWGGAWAIGSIVLLTLFVLLGIVPAIPPGPGLLRIAARFGLTGLLVGTGFSGFLAYAYRDQRLPSIRTMPFVLGGAVVAALLAPLAGGSALIGALLGGSTAGLTLTAARRADRTALTEGEQDLRLRP